MMKARCPKCGRKLSFGEDAIGRRGRCGACGQPLAVLRHGRLYCIEVHPCEKTVVTPSKLVVEDLAESQYPPDMPRPRQFKFGDHIGLYQPWVFLLLFGGLFLLLIGLAAYWPLLPSADVTAVDPAPAGTASVASPGPPTAPVLDAATPRQTQPSVSPIPQDSGSR